ncbi:MAG: LCP family protein, partial [Eubacteriales bacterium]|nr:LCP family protein [Eubacteriales bacterium]
NNGYPQNGYNNGRPQNAYADGYPENNPSAYVDDEEYRRVHEGDDYDFGFAPRKKKKKTKPQRPSRERNNYEDEESYEDRRPPRKEKRRKSHPFLRLLRTVLILAVILGGIGWFFLHMAFSKLDRVDPVANTAANRVTKAAGVTPYRENGVINILLIGQDARNGETQTRSDTMIICSLNRKTGKITLASLMRDMYVSIPGYDSEKLNAAYAYGGMELLDETIQIDFGINIDGNAVVDFDGFLTALTSVGNIEIELSQEEADYLNVNPALGENNDYIEGVLWNLTPGVNSLTPKQALAYSRMRYVGNSDWDRTTRQKKVIQAVFSKVKHNPVQLIRTMNAAAPSIKTDMSDSTLIRACLYAMLCGSDMKTALIPGEGMYYADNINGMAVLVPDLDACHQALLDYLYNGGSSIGTVNEQITDNTVQPTANDNNSSGTPDTSEWPDLDGDGIGDVDEDHDGIPDSWGDVW